MIYDCHALKDKKPVLTLTSVYRMLVKMVKPLQGDFSGSPSILADIDDDLVVEVSTLYPALTDTLTL
jgi:hypothetical protein